MRFVLHLSGFSMVFGLLACSSNSSTTSAIVRPELVSVDPTDFLGTVQCSAAPGAARSYVATLLDVSPDAIGKLPDPPFQLPSAPPTKCTQPVTFSFVVLGHRYLAQVDAYDVAPEQLTPLEPGSRLQLDSAGQRVSPRWQTLCGGYPISPGPDAGIDAGPEAAAGLPGVLSYSEQTQTPHDCGAGLHAADN